MSARPDPGPAPLVAGSAAQAVVRIGSGWAAYVGPSLGLAPHRGAVACLAVGVDAPLVAEADGTAVEARTVLVPAGLRHRIRARGDRNAFLYLDPGTADGPACRTRMTGRAGPLAHGHADEDALVAAVAAGDVVAFRGTATGIRAGTGPVDPRVRAALREIRAPGGADVPTEVLARRAGLSAARFRRLFAAEAGIGIRGYRRWARMIVVARVVAAGGDLTRAAADAGFATPSHLSLAFRQMFGLRPSLVLTGQVRIGVPGDALDDDLAGHVRDSTGAPERARLPPPR